MEFNNARGFAASMQIAPPFGFTDVTSCVFPLKASLPRLQSFCDAYLNQSDLVRFEPFVPYVYLAILDYGKMSIEAANLGWLSQHEVAFSVPLRWMVRDKRGRWKFQEFAVNCPFIFVDNELSMSTGREVYGWPKVLSRLDPGVSDWVNNPSGKQKVFEISTNLYDEMYKDKSAEFRPLIRVHHTEPNILKSPPEWDGLLRPIARMPNMAMNATRMGFDLLRVVGSMTADTLTGSSKFPNPLDFRNYAKAMGSGDWKDWLDPAKWNPENRELLWSLFPKASMNAINLKQFRDAESPWLACYQAIIGSEMKVQCLNEMGPLGEQNLAMGQLDGGYSVEIFRYPNQPIVDSLGLEVADTRQDGLINVESLRPILPFWLGMDCTYGRGEVITSRRRKRAWDPGPILEDIHGEESGTESTAGNEAEGAQAKKAEPESDGDSKQPAPEAGSASGDPARNGPLYNTARGGAVQAGAGPFALPNSTVRVLPLLADHKTLNGFVGDYLTVKGHRRFEAWGSHVYLIAYNYPHRSSEANRVGLIAGREVNFSVPVKQYEWHEDDDYDLTTPEGRAKRDREKLIGVALVTPFAYVDDVSVAITSSEVAGVPTINAEVGSPAHTWMETSGPATWTPQNLLSTSALVLPAVGVGAGATHEAFLRVSTEDILDPQDEASWREVARTWGPRMVEDLTRKYRERGYRMEQWSENESFTRVRAQALEILSGEKGVESFTLKQFRDCSEPENACYQALVRGRMKIDQLHEICEIEDLLHVEITRYPTQPVADILGLIPKSTTPGKGVQIFQAIRPFWLRADLTEECSETLFERSDGSEWAPASKEGISREEAGKEQDGWRQKTRSLVAGTRVLNHIDRAYVPDLAGHLQSIRSPAFKDPDAIREREKPVQDIVWEKLLEDYGKVSPATVLDSILSRRWARPKLLRKGLHKADFGVNVEVLGESFGEKLCPEFERQGAFWPLSDDCLEQRQNEWDGMAWKCWDAVEELVQDGHDHPEPRLEERDHPGGFPPGYNHEYNGDYRQLAKQCLPNWFLARPQEGTKPPAWKVDEWAAIAAGLEKLIGLSPYQVSWPKVIRPLHGWVAFCRRTIERLSVATPPDPSGRPPEGTLTTPGAKGQERSGEAQPGMEDEGTPPNVASVLRDRIFGL